MNVIVFVNNMFSLANDMLDFVFLVGGLFLLFAFPVYFFTTNLKKYTKEQKSRELLSQAIILFLIITVIGAIWASPEIISAILIWRRGASLVKEIAKWNEWAWIFSSIRLAMALGAFFFFAYLLGHEHGKNRWLLSALGYIAAIVIGWIVNRCMGILFISAPLIAAYYFTLHDLALVVMPTSNPEDRGEQKKRINAFISYTWGIQSPMTVVDDHAWKKYEPRIPGDITWQFSDFPIPIIKNLDWRPGLVWTRSHHVAAISGGTKFKRVEAPGVSFPGKLERLDQVFDLRLQLRTREIEVISKDGVPFIARYFTGFRIDNEEWTKDVYDAVRPLNPLLRGSDKLSYTKGSFSYNHTRVQATQCVTSTKDTIGSPIIYWDQWAANVVEDQTRKVLSQKNLDELWRPADDYKFASALDLIAGEIKRNSELILRTAGILLVVARVVNFHFDDPAEENPLDGISRQQLATWGSEWERKRIKVLSEANADAERAQQEARAYAESLLLNAISEGLRKTHEIHPSLPRYVIAIRFLSALQDYIHKDDPDDEEGKDGERKKNGKKREELSNYFKEWQEMFFPRQ